MKNVVLVHGAFADGASWNGVVAALQAKGCHVTAVQGPLTSLADDVATTKRALARQDGPTLLVGNSWGGSHAALAAHPAEVARAIDEAARQIHG